ASFTEEIRRLGHAPATRIVTARTMAAEPAVADALGIAHGAHVVHLERLRMADGEPLLLEQVFLPEARFPGLLASDLEGGSLYELLDARYDTRVAPPPPRPGPPCWASSPTGPRCASRASRTTRPGDRSSSRARTSGATGRAT